MMTIKIEINGQEHDRINVVNVGEFAVLNDQQYFCKKENAAYTVTHYDFAAQKITQVVCEHKRSDGKIKLTELVCQAILNNGKTKPVPKRRKSKNC